MARKFRIVEEMFHYARQRNISSKNLDRLKELTRNEDEYICKIAGLLVALAQIAPRRRHRIRRLMQQSPDLFDRLEREGLLDPCLF